MLQANRVDLELNGDTRVPETSTPAELLVSCWKFVRREYVIVLLCLLTALPLGGAYLLIAPASYTASAMLLIETRKGQFSPERAVVGDIPIDPAWIETQLTILVSEDLLASVAKDLGLADSPEFNTSLGQRAQSLMVRALRMV